MWVSQRSFHFSAPQNPASTHLEHATVEAGPGWSERPRASLSPGQREERDHRWMRRQGWAGSSSMRRSATPVWSAAAAGSHARPCASGGAATRPRAQPGWRSRAVGRPHSSPGRKVLEREEGLILQLRRERKLGLKRLRIELIRSHGLRLSLDTLHKVLVRHGLNRPPHGPKLKRKGTKRYSRPVPGDRVQLDTCKIAPGLYQYTAIDDCSRWQVLGVYPNRNAASTLDFLKRVRADMPFPVQR